MSTEVVNGLKLKAAKCRRNVIRLVEASHHGHLGGALSCLDIVTALYFYKMNIDPEDIKNENRDRFILSAGHKCMAQYAVLAEKGIFKKELLDTYGKLMSHLPGHPDMHKLPGIEANTGALGHGLAIGVGMAYGLKTARKTSNVYVVLGDGELAEGSNWEAIAAAAHFGVDNLTVFLDYNGLQISGKVEEVMNYMPLSEKFKSFGWAVKEIDGNSMEEIVSALDELPFKENKPSMIIAHTVKSKGISFAENKMQYHYWSPGNDELEAAIKETCEEIARLEKICMEGES